MVIAQERLEAVAEVAKVVLAELNLRDFIEQAWPVLEPATPFVPNWHIDCVCDHLEAVTRGEIKKLIINIPPGHMKSLTTCVFWPAWEWISAPWIRWLFASYRQDLAFRDSVKMRRLIESRWYQERWGSRYQLTGDQNEKRKFENTQTGFRLATGVFSATGERAQRVVWDDPHNIEEIESDVQRAAVTDAYDATFSQRGADPSTSTFVLIMQRLHEKDATGHLLEQGGFVHLKLPSEYEGEHIQTGIGWEDPRRRTGELLWPDRFTKEVLASAKATLLEYRYAGQHQQRPAPREGGLFKREWFEIVDAAPAQAVRVRAWDNAGTEADGDYTAGVLMSRTVEGMLYVEDVVRGQWPSGKRDAIKKQTAELDRLAHGNRVFIHNEQEAGSAGKDVAAYEVKMLAGYPVSFERPTGDKEIRAHPLASQASVGNVKLVRGPWIQAYLDELVIFPNGAHDDQVDASSAAFRKLLNFGGHISDQPREWKINTGARSGKPNLIEQHKRHLREVG